MFFFQQEQDHHEGEDEQEEEDIPHHFPEFQDNYKDVLHSLSKKWLDTQLHHKVSATATNKFWELSVNYMSKMASLWEREGQPKQIPGFIHQRRKLYEEYSIDIEMEFGFKNKRTGTIEIVKSSSAPLKRLQHHEDYIKL